MARASRTGAKGLYKGADGTYRIDLRWQDLHTAEHKRYREKLPKGTTATTAKARVQKISAEILAGTFDPDREAPITVRAAFDRYLAHCETHGIKSTRSRRTHAKAICSFFGEQRSLSDVAAFDVERFKAHLRASSRTITAKPAKLTKSGEVKVPATPERSVQTAPATVNRHIATMKQLARWAAREGLLDAARAAELRDVRQLREPAGRVRWLDDSEAKVIQEKLTGWLRPIVFTALGTGARRTEIAGLRWRDVDRAHGELVLTRTKNRKTRHVPISSAVLALIDAQAAGEPDAFVFEVPKRASRKPEEALRRTEEERRGDVVTKAFAGFCEAHGLADLHVHDLRHHAASMMRRAGHGLDVVATVLGHSDIRVASRYAHIGRTDLEAAVRDASSSLTADDGLFAQPLPTEDSDESASARKDSENVTQGRGLQNLHSPVRLRSAPLAGVT